MSLTPRDMFLFLLVFALIAITGFTQSWNVALGIVNMGLISAIMALGVNMQWGYAGLFNIGVMGFVALGGLGAVIVSMPPVGEAWAAGGLRVIGALIIGIGTIVAASLVWKRLPASKLRGLFLIVLLVAGFFLFRALFDPAVEAIEKISPAVHRLSRWPWPASPDLMARWRSPCCRGRMGCGQDSPWPPLRLPCHRNAGHRRDCHRSHEERRLVVARRQERDRRAPPRALRDRPAK